MALMNGRNVNTNTDAVVSTVPLNSTTSVVIAAANPDRTFFHVNSDGSGDKDCWIRLYASSVDNLKQGFYLYETDKGINSWEMPPDNIYTGEISAIAEATPVTLNITEY